MQLKKIGLGIIGSICFAVSVSNASIVVPMTLVDARGHGIKVGTIKLDDTIYGLILTPKLHDLPAGMHGFDVFTNPSCGNYAQAAGSHLDPEYTDTHRGPFRGSGHLGDLPVLMVNSHGYAKLPVLAPRLKISQIVGRSLVIMAGGDNYSDTSQKEYANTIRIACGIITYH